MKLVQRYPYSNLYHLKGRRFKSILGGVPNVPYDNHGNLAPLDNEVVITTNPIAGYILKRGPFLIGFHDRQNNRYGTAIKLRTGETLIKRGIGDPTCTPTIIDGRTLQWKYANGSWIREYATEKKVKEIIFQKSGQVIKFRYTVNGFTIKKVGQQIEFYKGNRLAFVLQRPYYCTVDGDFISYVNVSWVKVGNNWKVTYPAPSSDKYIDPVIVFGKGAGMVGGDHKDTVLVTNNAANSFGQLATLQIRNFGIATLTSLIRFSLTGYIPTNASVNSSDLTLTLNAQNGAFLVGAYHIISNWGITSVDAGISQAPAVLQQATWNSPFAVVGPDPLWAGGGVWSNADHNAAETTWTIGGADPPGTTYNISIPIMTQAWINNDAINYGVVLEGVNNINQFNIYDSLDAIVPANRLIGCIDGAQVVLAFHPPIPAQTFNMAAMPFYVGLSVVSFDGAIDEVRVHNGSLSVNQNRGQYDNQAGADTNATITFGDGGIIPESTPPPPEPEVEGEYRKILRQYKIFWRYFFLPILQRRKQYATTY